MARGTSCFAHTHTTLVPIESHHVWPLGYHGPNVLANRKDACANAHSDTHYLLERLLKTAGDVPWAELRTYGPGVRATARSGFDQIMAYAAKVSTST